MALKYSGVVLRGSGRTGDPAVSTIIRSTATGGTENNEIGVECPIRIGSDDPTVNWETRVGNTIPVASVFVPAGSRRLTLKSTAGLSVGDNIIIWHPCTQEWIAAIDHGGVNLDPPWAPGDEPIMYNRFIKAIQGNDIVICAPVSNDLDASLSESFVYKWPDMNEVVNAGVENLRVDMGDPDEQNEAHPDSCIVVSRSRDTWVRNVSTLHFKRSGVMVRRSHLFTNVWASQARHAFVSGGGAATAGVVWLDSRSNNGYLESGGHAHWSQGLLFDNVREELNSSDRLPVLNLHNRVDGGADETAHAHGWSSVYSVLWNCTVDNNKQACVQRPPTSQNFAIGTAGRMGVVTGENWLGVEKIGYEEHTNKAVKPVSLYRKQLADRLA
ncbi:hypothetical protein [Kribbella catacumbae]|uniref:hypothetical protein n=1 Tax=Kribbella catacumbae TaxID=460086 RepID=UPI0003A8AF9A|nr:hypothetical protein [Kribbella catacumbae]